MPWTDYAGLGGKPVELYHFAMGSTEWFWTSAEVTVTAAIPGVAGGAATDYTPMPLARGRVVSDQEATTQNVEITCERDNPIALLFATSAPASPVGLTIYGWQRDDVGGTATFPALFAGQVKAIKSVDTTATLVCGPYQDLVNRKLLTVLAQPTCNNTLYGTRCAADRAAHTHTGTVKAVDPTHTVLALDNTLAAVFASDVGTYGHGRLVGGEIVVNGTRRTVVNQDCAAGTVTLIRAIEIVKPSDALTCYEGCDKLHDTCLSQFDNLSRFQGFPYVPTRNPFNGSVV